MNFRTTTTLALLLLAGAARADAVLTVADQPLRLMRGTAVYKAPVGMAVQKADILETGNAGAQIEDGPGFILALGPHTRVCLHNLPEGGKGAAAIALLQGWAKVSVKAPAQAMVSTPTLQVTLPGGTSLVRSEAGKDGLFAEDGAQQVARLDARGHAGPPLKLATEQYAAPAADKPQPIVGRPPHEFIAAMPPAFSDALASAPRGPKAGKVPPLKEHEAEFSDVADWLLAPAPLRVGFVARFKPRLADPAFRKELDQRLGQSAEWKPILRPAMPAASTLF